MFASASWGSTEGLDFLIRLAAGGSVGSGRVITTLLAGMLLCYIVLTQVGKTWFVRVSQLNHRDSAICRGDKTQPTKKKNSTQIELSQQFALPAGERDEITPIWRNKASAKKMPVKRADSHLSAACFVGQHQIGRSIILNLFLFHFVTQVLIIL